jgi:hypothetical protein
MPGELEAATLDVALSRVLEVIASKDCQYINLDQPIHEFGGFMHHFLAHSVPYAKLLESSTAAPDQRDALKANLAKLRRLFGKTQPPPLLERCLVLLDADTPDANTELVALTRCAAVLFETRPRRAQAELQLAFPKRASMAEVRTANDKLTKYLQKDIVARRFDGQPQFDVTLTTVQGCTAVQDYLKRHRKAFLRCACSRRADAFAVPCSCPCCCIECWGGAPERDARICPQCGRPITEFVTVQHD